MGNIHLTYRRSNFEDMQFAIKHSKLHLLINTLSTLEQDCLIFNTIKSEEEEFIVNELLSSGKKDINIIIYGKNSSDDKIFSKYKQFQSLGFYNVYVYIGGLFEWMMLQDIYGDEEFPTTKKEIDILKFKPNKTLNVPLLTN